MDNKIIELSVKDHIEILKVWEASVRETHHFLTEEDIQFYKPLILNKYLHAVDLYGIHDQQQKIMGFLGIVEGNIEMLFMHPNYRGKGVGKALLTHATQQLKANKVDVNEQNEQAVGFYQHLGFSIINRSATDGMGKPFPILHMELT